VLHHLGYTIDDAQHPPRIIRGNCLCAEQIVAIAAYVGAAYRRVRKDASATLFMDLSKDLWTFFNVDAYGWDGDAIVSV